MHKQGSILVAVLWCLALLGVVVIGSLHTARLDLLIVKNYGDRIQAHYLALAGIEKAKALLFHEAKDRRGLRQNHCGDLWDAPHHFRDVSLGRGRFRVFCQGPRDEVGGVVYGVKDEESRLNLNHASAKEMEQLEGMSPPAAASIIDYRDEDHEVSPGGAEAEDYAHLHPPYLPRDGPFLTTRELLMVRGISPELFLGEDANQNGLLDLEEDDGRETFPPDNRNGVLDAGWSGLVTVHSSVEDCNAAGETRINIQSGTESALTSVEGISADLARAIVEYRGRHRLESLADLLDVVELKKENQPRSPEGNDSKPTSKSPGRGSSSPANPSTHEDQPTSGAAASNSAPASTPTGQKLVSEDLLMEIADDLTAEKGLERPGVVNVNTAGPEVLACLPGIDEEMAEAIVSYRESSGFLPNIAWLLKVPGLDRKIFQKVCPRVSARSETFRILSEGKVESSGARKRLQAIVRIGSYRVDTLAFREDL